jgi:hypothetical protein
MPRIKAPPKAFIYEAPPDRLGNKARTAFEKLKQEMGPRGATFLGRAISADDTLESVLKRIPAGEMEEAGSTIKSVTFPEGSIAAGFGHMDPAFSLHMILSEPFLRRPGGVLKFLRRKIQEYTDPEGEIMEPRPAPGQWMQQVDILAALIAEQLKGVEQDTIRHNMAVRIKRAADLQKPRKRQSVEQTIVQVIDETFE